MTASHDQAKNNNSTLFKQKGSKLCNMKSSKKQLNIDKSEPLKLLNCSIFSKYAPILMIWVIYLLKIANICWKNQKTNFCPFYSFSLCFFYKKWSYIIRLALFPNKKDILYLSGQNLRSFDMIFIQKKNKCLSFPFKECIVQKSINIRFFTVIAKIDTFFLVNSSRHFPLLLLQFMFELQ